MRVYNVSIIYNWHLLRQLIIRQIALSNVTVEAKMENGFADSVIDQSSAAGACVRKTSVRDTKPPDPKTPDTKTQPRRQIPRRQILRRQYIMPRGTGGRGTANDLHNGVGATEEGVKRTKETEGRGGGGEERGREVQKMGRRERGTETNRKRERGKGSETKNERMGGRRGRGEKERGKEREKLSVRESAGQKKEGEREERYPPPAAPNIITNHVTAL